MNDTKQTNFKYIISFGKAVTLGFIGGAVVSIPDIRQAVSSLATTGLTVNLIVRIALTNCTAAIALALAGVAVTEGQKQLQSRFSCINDWLAASVMAALSAPWLIHVARSLFQGGFTSRLPFSGALMALTALLLIVGLLVGVRIALALLRHVDDEATRRPNRLAVFLGLTIFAMSLRWCDAHLYKRLYTYLHTTLSLGTLVLAMLAIRTLFRPQTAERIRAVLGIAVLATMVALTINDVISPETSQTVRMAANENTATAASLRKLLPWNQVAQPQLMVTAAKSDQFVGRPFTHRGQFPFFPNANLVLISVDALRADKLGAYGHTGRNLTPNIDTFAQDSTVFKRAYCAVPHSSFSITSFHTSRNTHVETSLGKQNNAPTIADVLRPRGYRTVGLYTNGIFYTEGERVAHYKAHNFGFEQALHPGSDAKKMTNRAIGYLKEHENRETPLFLWVHYFNVHEPYRDTRFGTSASDRYDGEVQVADKAVGRLVEYIKTHNPDTVVVFVADHGEEFNEHGGFYHGSSLYEEQVRVPFIVRVPNGTGQIIATPVSLLDLPTTVLGLLDVQAPITMLGRDLRPAIFKGNAALSSAPVFSTVMKQHMVVSWPWKLIAHPAEGLYQLFNLETDKAEQKNLFDGASDRAAQLESLWRGWLDHIASSTDPAQTALNMGRVRDNRAVPALIALAKDSTADAAHRMEALDLLAKIRGWNQPEKLRPLLKAKNKKIAIRAALALAAIDDHSGESLLLEGLKTDEDELKYDCAIALGKAGNKAAIDALIETLKSPDIQTRKNAARLLGDLKAEKAIEPLIDNLSNRKTCAMTMVSLGKIGDSTAVAPILGVLDKEKLLNIRGFAVMALGWLGARDTAPRLMEVLLKEPEIRWTTQSLLYTGAIEQGLLAGTDISEATTLGSKDFVNCTQVPGDTIKTYMGATTCTTRSNTAAVVFKSKSIDAQEVIIRLRHTGKIDQTHRARVTLDGTSLGTVEVTHQMQEFRIPAGGMALKSGKQTVKITMDESTFELDHVLIVPKPPAQ